MPGVSLEEIQEEFADLDIDITDGDVLSKLQVNILIWICVLTFIK